MSYSLDTTIKCLQKEVSGFTTEVEGLSSKVAKQEQELTEMKREVEAAKAELCSTKHVLVDVTNKLRHRDHEVHKCHQKLEAVHYEESLLGKNDGFQKLPLLFEKKLVLLYPFMVVLITI